MTKAELRNLAGLLNLYAMKLPRIVGTLVSQEVPGDWDEVMSPFRDRMSIYGTPSCELGDKIPELMMRGSGGASGMNLAGLLSAFCETQAYVGVRWVNGVPQLRVS